MKQEFASSFSLGLLAMFYVFPRANPADSLMLTIIAATFLPWGEHRKVPIFTSHTR